MELRNILCLLVFVSSYATSYGNVWTHKRKNHKSKSLTTGKVQRLVENSSVDKFKELLKPLLVERVSGTESNKNVRQYIIDTMTDFNWSVQEYKSDQKTPFGMKEFVNVVATQNPAAPRRLTLACHYDSKFFTKFKFVAATDSAVPCAMMLDVVRVLNPFLLKSSMKDVSLQLIFFDGEEAFVQWSKDDSLYGSRQLAEQWSKDEHFVEREVKVSDMDRMNCLVLLDLIGNRGLKFRNWFSPTSKLFERLQKIEQRIKQQGLLRHPTGLYFIGDTLHNGMGIEDDHIPFLNKGVPVLHLIAYPFPDTWHKSTDDEAHLDYDTITDLSKILYVFVAEYLHISPN